MPPFAGPPEQPRRWDKPSEPPQKLLSRDFILLFCMAMFSNSYIAVFYCFEQWLEGSLSRATVKVSPLLRDEVLTPPSARQDRQEEDEDEDGRSDMVDASAGAEERFDAGAAGVDAGSVKPAGDAGADQPPRRNGAGGSGRR